jgi:threonine dehydrogenase-like Zn-dependent dehydrogenase
MRAIAVIAERRTVDIIDCEPPRLRTATDVRLRMLEVGVCGTDREIGAFDYGTPPDGVPHLVIGHESLGEVIEVGPGVTRVRVGDLVAPMVRRPCRHEHCGACREARQDFCFTGDFHERGIKDPHGFMTEEVVDDEVLHGPGAAGAARGRRAGRAADDCRKGAGAGVGCPGPARSLLLGRAGGIKNVLTFN